MLKFSITINYSKNTCLLYYRPENNVSGYATVAPPASCAPPRFWAFRVALRYISSGVDGVLVRRVGVERGGDVGGGHEALLARELAPHARPAVARVRLQHQQPLAALHTHRRPSAVCFKRIECLAVSQRL